MAAAYTTRSRARLIYTPPHCVSYGLFVCKAAYTVHHTPQSHTHRVRVWARLAAAETQVPCTIVALFTVQRGSLTVCVRTIVACQSVII